MVPNRNLLEAIGELLGAILSNRRVNLQNQGHLWEELQQHSANQKRIMTQQEQILAQLVQRAEKEDAAHAMMMDVQRDQQANSLMLKDLLARVEALKEQDYGYATRT